MASSSNEGFQPASREEYQLTVENICLQNIYPPFFAQTTVVNSDIPGRVFLVIEVEESAHAPHAIENSTKVYVRTGNASNLYDLADVDSILELVKRRKDPFERRERLVERAKQRFDTHFTRKHADLGGSRAKLGTVLQLSIGPQFPSRQLCHQEDLKAHVQSWTPWRGSLFPDPGSPLQSQYESAVVLDAVKGSSFFEANVWGLLFYGARIHVESAQFKGIGLAAYLGFVLFFIRHAAKMLQAFGYSGSIEIETILSPVRGINWLQDWSGYPVVTSGSELDDEVSIRIPTTSELLREKPDRIATEIFKNVFFSVNCAEMVDTPVKLERLVLRGYDYNGWPTVTK